MVDLYMAQRLTRFGIIDCTNIFSCGIDERFGGRVGILDFFSESESLGKFLM